MPASHQSVRVAVNVMRARLTVLGFNIAIVSFQISQLNRNLGGLRVPGIDHSVHIGADMALFIGLGLSLIALVVFIMSSTFDEVGYCTHWSLVAGDLLMYLALAHTVAGFFSPLSTSFEIFGTKLPAQALEINILHTAILVTGGVAWFSAIYAGPVVSLLRSPFRRRINMRLGVAYIALLLMVSWVNFQSAKLNTLETVETLSVREGPGLIIGVLKELVQPFTW